MALQVKPVLFLCVPWRFRAILDIYEISECFGKRLVQAVVLMSPEQVEEWKTDLNAEREFTGVLIALKPYSRKLYVK